MLRHPIEERMSNHVDVVIAGAGPTGLFLGCILAENGVAFRIIDKLSAPRRISKATGIMPRTLEIFQGAGLAERFIAAGNKIRDLAVYGSKGKLLGLSFDRLDSPYPFPLGLEQFRTEELLTDRLRELGVKIEREKELTSFEQDDEKVWATLAGADGSSETVECSYLVGCDGAHSTVRHTLRLPFDGSEDPQHYLVAYLSIDWEIPSSEMFEFGSAKGTIFGIPLPEGRWAVAGEYDRSQWHHGEDDEPDLEEVEKLFDQRSPVPATLSNPLWLSYFRVNHRQVSQYQVGRVFLAGDAAHVHSPVGGQGMNTGLQDACNLGWKLASVLLGRSRPELLASYHAERHPVGRSVVHLTSFLQAELNLRAKIAMGLRDELSQLVGHSTYVKNLASRHLGELSYHYRHSPAVSEWTTGTRASHQRARKGEFAECPEFAAGPHAGDRAPDGVLLSRNESGKVELGTLYELLRCGIHTLMVFEGTHAPEGGEDSIHRLTDGVAKVQMQFPQLLQSVVIRSHHREENEKAPGNQARLVYDDEGILHHRYGGRSECLYLIRPDGYVAYRSEPADADRLIEYLDDVGFIPVGGLPAG